METLTWRFLFLFLLTIGERKCECALSSQSEPMVTNVTVLGNDLGNELITQPPYFPTTHNGFAVGHCNETFGNQTCMGVVTSSSQQRDDYTDTEEKRPDTQRGMAEDDGIVSRADYGTVVLVTGYTTIPVFICSTIFNILNIVVYSQKTTTSSTFIVASGIIDITWNLATAFLQVVPLFVQTNSKLFNGGDFSTNILIFMYFGTLLSKMDLSLNALISVDRFLVISGGTSSRNVLQRYPKCTVCIIGFIGLGLSFFDAYAMTLGRTGSLPLMNVSLTKSNATNETGLELKESFLDNETEGNCSDNENADVGVQTSDSDSNTGVVPQSDGDEFSNSTSKCNTTTLSLPKEPPQSVIDDIVRGIALFNKATVYTLNLLMIICNIATLVFLKKMAMKRTGLGISTPIDQEKQDERRQNVILLTMTTVYVILGLPQTSVSFVKDLQIWPEFEVGRKEKFLLISVMKCLMLCDMVKNAFDFVVYIVMSKSFRSKVKSAVCHRRPRPQSQTFHTSISHNVSRSVSNFDLREYNGTVTR